MKKNIYFYFMENLSFYEIIQNNSIEKTLKDQAAAAGVDLLSCNINTWKALLQEVGALLFPKKSRVLKIKIQHEHNYNNIPCYNYIYDFNKIDLVCDQYIYLSHKYNKLIAVVYFGYLINTDNCYIYNLLKINNNNENDIYNIIPDNYNYLYSDFEYSITAFNNIKNNIIKKLKNERENNLKEKCFEAPGAVGAIAIGNTENGWNLTPGQKAATDHAGELLSVAALPPLLPINSGSGARAVLQGTPNETNNEII